MYLLVFFATLFSSLIGHTTHSMWSRMRACFDDNRLIQSVHQAAANHAPPNQVELRVGVQAAINTLRANERDYLNFASFDSDISHARIPNLYDGKTVLYWIRPIQSKHPRIIGIIWDDAGVSTVFYGVILPPR